jgi:acetyl-CoA carboxylase biotin carboxylase subunit
MICKLIVFGKDRETARLGMLDALDEFQVAGIKTTIPAHKQILADERFISGNYDTSLIAQLLD